MAYKKATIPTRRPGQFIPQAARPQQAAPPPDDNIPDFDADEREEAHKGSLLDVRETLESDPKKGDAWKYLIWSIVGVFTVWFFIMLFKPA